MEEYKMTEKYNVNYTCGCVHEIEIKQGIHMPTGKQDQCKEHKKVK